ncbi:MULTISPECIES: hypothetical protein [unclassified Synechococcus]|uniref:hypothetical protein n=1 Tax=unclassified Synechococcus TaxID=2626047 RepID=UPI001C236B8A|nr:MULTISPECIES: hypothetical protein [unclassified Synechococcus]
MNDAYVRICRLLAASGYREKELFEFIEKAAFEGPKFFLSTIRELRELENNQSVFHVFVDTPSHEYKSPPSEAAIKIERLLIDEARMPRTVAINALSEEVKRHFPSRHIPPESRKGFVNWIRRLSEVVPEKDLLFLATAIRNRVVQDAPSDWRLK